MWESVASAGGPSDPDKRPSLGNKPGALPNHYAEGLGPECLGFDLMRFCFQDCFDVVNGRRKTSSPEAWLAWSVT